MYYTEIGLYWISSANLHPHFQNKILQQTLWFSLWDFHAPNELIQPANLSHSHLSLPPSLEWHGPGQTWGEGYNLFSLSKLAMTAQPDANCSHLEIGPALVRLNHSDNTPAITLENTRRVMTLNSLATKVRPSLCHCFTFLPMFTSPIH